MSIGEALGGINPLVWFLVLSIDLERWCCGLLLGGWEQLHSSISTVKMDGTMLNIYTGDTAALRSYE